MGQMQVWYGVACPQYQRARVYVGCPSNKVVCSGQLVVDALPCVQALARPGGEPVRRQCILLQQPPLNLGVKALQHDGWKAADRRELRALAGS